MLLSDLGGGENPQGQKLSLYCAVYVTPQDSSVWGVATGEGCSQGSSVDVHQCCTMVYLLSCGKAFWDQQVLLSEIS